MDSKTIHSPPLCLHTKVGPDYCGPLDYCVNLCTKIDDLDHDLSDLSGGHTIVIRTHDGAKNIYQVYFYV